MNVQILVLPGGRLVWASDPYPGSMHDVAALDASGLLEGIDPSGWIADKGYIGRGMITPHKKPPNGELSEAAKEANKSINKIRQVVERTIAHIKSWRIHPHRLPPPPAHIRADHHRRTLTPRIQNHPLNKLPETSPFFANAQISSRTRRWGRRVRLETSAFAESGVRRRPRADGDDSPGTGRRTRPGPDEHRSPSPGATARKVQDYSGENRLTGLHEKGSPV